METGRQSRKPLILLAIGFLLVAVSMLIAYRTIILQERAAGSVRHTLQAQRLLSNVGRNVTQAEAAQRGYLLSGDSAYLAAYQRSAAELPTVLDTLARSVQDNPRQVAATARLRELVRERMALIEGSVQLAEQGRAERARELVRAGRGQRVTADFSALLSRMFEEEQRQLEHRSELAARRILIAKLALGAAFLMAMVLAVFAVRETEARLRTLGATVARLNAESLARSEAQSQVRQLQKMEAIGQLTGGIAHDFNNMLAIVMGAIDLARRRLNRGDVAGVEKTLDHAQEGADRAAALTAQLLAFARRQPLEPRVLDANKLVGGISELLRRTLGEQVQIETVLAGGLWQIHADPEQLESSLVNLAVNGRDAMPEGGKLTIETANTELDERYAQGHDEVVPGQYVMISVTDTGMGMSPEVADQVFEPFFTTKEVGRGTGLGLSQVYGFVKQSSGHVKVYSEPGQGTTIKIYLPRFVGVLAPMVAATAGADIPLARPGEVILVVEDEPRVRRLSLDALTELGYEVVEAANGEEALALIATEPRISLLFTDIVMPGMSGRALADRAHENRPELKVVYTTGYTRNAIVHNGVVDYGIAFIQKPFTIAALARKLREVLDRPS